MTADFSTTEFSALSFISLLYTFGLAASIIGLIAVITQKPSEEQKAMMGLNMFVTISWLGYWLCTRADDLHEYITCSKLIYTGGCHLYFFMLMFICSYCEIKLPKIVNVLLVSYNCILNALIIATNPETTYFYVNPSLIAFDDHYSIIAGNGPVYWIYLLTNLGYCVAVVGVLLYAIAHEKSGLGKLIGLVLSALSPFFFSMLYSIKVTEIDLTPIGYIVSEAILLLLIYVSKLYDVRDTAREYIISSLKDGIVVLDRMYRIKGWNDTASEIFPELGSASMNNRIEDVSDRITNVLYHSISSASAGDHSDSGDESSAKSGKPDEKDIIVIGERSFRPSIRKINDDKNEGSAKGVVIWFTDITNDLNYQNDLERDVKIKTQRIKTMQRQIIYSFATLTEKRDNETGEHVKRTSAYVEILANELRFECRYPQFLNDTNIEYLKLAAPLHDIGKMAVPDSILKKPGKLTDEEFNQMKSHTIEGGRILDETMSDIEGDGKDEDGTRFFTIARDIALFHHEKWNGRGYPTGISGENIPVAARIMAVADFFDALTSERPYKKAYSLDQAYAILDEEKGQSLDPTMVDAFMHARSEVEKIVFKTRGLLAINDAPLSERDRAAIERSKKRKNRINTGNDTPSTPSYVPSAAAEPAKKTGSLPRLSKIPDNITDTDL